MQQQTNKNEAYPECPDFPISKYIRLSCQTTKNTDSLHLSGVFNGSQTTTCWP